MRELPVLRRRNVCIKFNRKPESKGHLRELDVDAKMILKDTIASKGIGYETVHWIHLTLDGDQRYAIVNMKMNHLRL
jgi:hypothetical protein